MLTPDTSIRRLPTSDLNALQEILKDAPQDLWLMTAFRTQSAIHDPLIHWMLDQTQCDFSIALWAFYRSEPCQYLEDPVPLPTHPDHSQIFAQLLRNWDTGFYRTHELAVDVDQRYRSRLKQKLLAWPRGALPFSVPSAFLESEGGRTIQLPAHYDPDTVPHIRAVFDACDLRLATPGRLNATAVVRDLFRRLSSKIPG